RPQERVSGGDFSGRGLHATEDHVLAGEGRLYTVVYILRVAQYEGGDHRVLFRNQQAAGERLLSPERLAEHARHSYRISSIRRTRRVCNPVDPRGNTLIELR